MSNLPTAFGCTVTKKIDRMFPLAEKEMVRQNFKDVAYFEPFYLKEFVASKPKKLL